MESFGVKESKRNMLINKQLKNETKFKNDLIRKKRTMVVSILILSSILKDYIGDIYLCPGRDKTFRLNTANAFLN